LKVDERLEFEALRVAVQSQLEPATVMQWIAFERVLCCIVRIRLALRREMRRLDRDPDVLMQQDRSLDDGAEKAGPPHWYGSGRAELQAATRMLARLRREIETNNFHHPEEWKEPLTKTFGDQFYQVFSNWSPQDFEATLLARQLRAHAKNFEMPLPESFQASNSTPTVGDSGSQQQMMLKVVDLALQQVDDFRRFLDERSSAGDSQRFASAERRQLFFPGVPRSRTRR
jgi:hypothetical protein